MREGTSKVPKEQPVYKTGRLDQVHPIGANAAPHPFDRPLLPWLPHLNHPKPSNCRTICAWTTARPRVMCVEDILVFSILSVV